MARLGTARHRFASVLGLMNLSCAKDFDGRYTCMMASSTNLYGLCSERYEAIPHAGQNVFFQDRMGRGWSTFFGSDATAPWRERPGILPLRFDDQGRIRPE